MRSVLFTIILFGVCSLLSLQQLPAGEPEQLKPVAYNHPGLKVDLGVGLWAWPLPMDYDNDGDYDLVVGCPDKPYNGTYFFENTTGNVKFPVFKPAVKINKGYRNMQVSFVPNDKGKPTPRVLVPGNELVNFPGSVDAQPKSLGLKSNIHNNRVRANQWKYADYDGDGDQDLIVGVGDWTDYGWDDAFDKTGVWQRGPLRGFVYFVENTGTDAKPTYGTPVKVTLTDKGGERPIEVFGAPSPNFADFDNDGDLDLLCGEFLDRFTYFQNIGSRTKPLYTQGRFLKQNGQPIQMDLQMIIPVAIDWDKDGDIDLVVGDEDGRVALVENSGNFDDDVPVFLPPKYFQQEAENVKFGALATPVGVDWNNDGKQDIICGNTAGYIGYIENLGGDPIKWAAPRYLKADGQTIRVQAGTNGSIQGPCEAKWGYTTLTVADWDHDGKLDLIINGIWGKVQWFQNVGTTSQPELTAGRPVEVEWTGAPPKPAWNWWSPQGRELVTQWRTTPVVVDFNHDGLNDLVMLDHEGFLAFFERKKVDNQLRLQPGKRIFVEVDAESDLTLTPLRLNSGTAGKSGRRKLHIVDWDGDGRLDLLVNSVNAEFYRNVGETNGKTKFVNEGHLDLRKLAGHTSSPTTVDWNNDDIPDLLVGAEDGFLYHKKNPRKPE